MKLLDIDIKNCFPTSNKRVLSDQSENGEESKKLREGSVGSNPESTEEVFCEVPELETNPEIVTENQSVEVTLKDLQAKMVEMFKGTLMQIWKSADIFVFPWK